MTDWSTFPTRTVDVEIALFRIHHIRHHPAWFNSDGTWRFDPTPVERDRFGVCYLGHAALACYVEVFGRFRAVTQAEIDPRALSELHTTRAVELADLTDRRVLGQFGVTATHSTGADYRPAQELASELFEAGLAGVLYRVRHDPAMALEGVALFGPPGEHPDLFSPPKTLPIPDDLIEAARREFRIDVIPSAILP